MPKTKNAKNCSTYKWHVIGEIAGQTIDKKYCSINIFVDEFGGEKTPMNLNKSKVLRLKKMWKDGRKISGNPDPSDTMFAKNWRVSFEPISEKRVLAYTN